MKKIYLVVLFSFFGLGCDFGSYVSTFDVPYKPQLVIYGLIQAEKPWQILVKNNIPVPSNAAYSGATSSDVPNAIVKVYEGDTLIGNLSYDEQKQAFGGLTNHLPQMGKSYKIQVSATSFPDAEAETWIPFPSSISNWKATFLNDKKGSDKEIGLGFEIADESEEKDYYQLTFQSNSYKDGLPIAQGSSNLIIKDEVIISSLDLWDKITQIQNAGNFICDTCTFSDAFFSGKQHYFNVNILPDKNSGQHFAKVQHQITLRQMNEDLYRFMSSQQKQALTEGDPLASPIPIQSNVKGGLGVLGAFYEQKYLFVVE
jgi:hypothetical protein